ncbi:MAG TPA: HAD family hydrolase [Candidatus Tumulicola sp.]|jgi:HAD superfamily hydrolase (TIGR01509 family)
MELHHEPSRRRALISGRAVLLDVDGTLIRSNQAHAVAWSRAFHAHGYDVSVERILPWLGMGGDKLLGQVDPQLDPEKGTGAAIGAFRDHLFLSEYVMGLQPTNGAKALLARIGAAGLVRAVATSAKKPELTALLAASRLAGEIDVAATSDDVSRSKPDADIVHAALAKASSRPQDAVFLGDTPYDIEAAHRAGVVAVVVRSGIWSDEDLAAAEAIFDDPADLCERFAGSPIARLLS